VIWLVPLEAAVDENVVYPYVYSLHYVLPFTVCVSTWLITARDNDAPAPERGLSLRQAIRIAITVWTVIELVLLAGWHTGSFRWSVIGVAWSVLGIAEAIMFYTYVRGMGFRGGDLFVASHAPIVMWIENATIVIAQLLPWGQALLRHFGWELSSGPPHLERLLGIVSGIYAAIYLWNARNMLRRAAVQARANWREREPIPPAS
jgi:hypothetical protein